jgi:hypothetical protein
MPGEQETLVLDGKVLVWSGNADYWAQCRSKCLRLAEKGDGSQERMPVEANQQVFVSLRPIATRK